LPVTAEAIIQGGGPAATIAGPYTDGAWLDNILFKTDGPGSMPSGAYTTVDPLLVRDVTGATAHILSVSEVGVGGKTSSR